MHDHPLGTMCEIEAECIESVLQLCGETATPDRLIVLRYVATMHVYR